MENHIETEQDLQQLIGQYESIRLDFKASKLLSQPKDLIIKQLTEDASAFANTEGGIIVIGLREGKSGKKSVATELDEGVDPAEMPPERLEQLIASNISPPVSGLVVRPIRLAGPRAGKVAYVVRVPKGTTAYQATKTLRYYGRTDFAASPLHDSVIRLLMTRRHVAHAVMEIAAMSGVSADDEYADRQSQLLETGRVIPSQRRVHLKAPKRSFDEYTFALQIRNDGPMTIRDCLLSVSVTAPLEIELLGSTSKGQPWLFQFGAENRIVRHSHGLGFEEARSSQARLFPEHAMPFPGAQFLARVAAGEAIPDGTLEWKLYLDDAPSHSGSISLARELGQLTAFGNEG